MTTFLIPRDLPLEPGRKLVFTFTVCFDFVIDEDVSLLDDDEPVTLDKIEISVTTGQTGGLVRAALFRDNGAGYPGAIVAGTDTGDLDGTGTA